MNSFCNFIITTNHYFSLKISEYDRRYACFKCSNEYVGNLDYFKILRDNLNQATANAFVTYLYKYFDDIVEIRKIPQTSFRDELIERSKPDYQIFYNKLREDVTAYSNNIDVLEIDNQTWIIGDGLYLSYKKWCEDEGIKSSTKQTFLANINTLNKGKRRYTILGKRYTVYAV